MPCPQLIVELVQRFRDNQDAYRSGGYNEAQLRREFIDPFFEALGWDVTNRRGHAEPYKDVIHEDSIKFSGGATKAPDYCFRVGGTRKFFLEAKTPSITLSRDPAPAFQLRRYAWSSKLPLSILTNFAEFAVYDCRFKPSQSDRPTRARVMYLRYTEYPQRWGEIEGLFSLEAVLRGAFDRFADVRRPKRGTATVDEAFLRELERWREMLARSFAADNRLTVRQINAAVQSTIDRIVFLRICEDRGIERYETLHKVAAGDHVYRRLCHVFEDADDRYNSGLFHFKPEKGRSEPPDTISLRLKIDDRPLRDILRNLYYPASPYEFSVLPADILGQVYEQFLGSVITLTGSGRAAVKIRPEVRKAGGVYYTPGFVVRYIIDHAVAPTFRDLDPKAASKLRILDPACGSGSFLLGAYDWLLQWHLEWYRQHEAERWARGRTAKLRRDHVGEWRLTTGERKRILLNSIYGVDIDAQAIEVTKLSLLLKVLEGENQDSLTSQLRLFRERALPDLGSNIKCGNALIDVDIYRDLLSELGEGGLDATEAGDADELNAFQWSAAFPFLERTRGFDAVIGNPPWGADLGQAELEYLRAKHGRVVSRMIDSYIYFLDKTMLLTKTGAPVGMIVPATILNQVDAAPLRRLLAERGLTVVVNLGRHIFGPNVLNTSAIVVSQPQTREGRVLSTDVSHLPLPLRQAALSNVHPTPWTKFAERTNADPHATFFVASGAASDVLLKARKSGRLLLNVLQAKIQRGVTPDVVAAHLLTSAEARSRRIETDLLRKSVSGSQVRRYNSPWEPDQLLLYTHRGLRIEDYPNALNHLRRFREAITCPEVQERKHPWWVLHRSRDPEIFGAPKFIGLTTTPCVEVIYDKTDGLYVTDAFYVFRTRPDIDPWAFMALIQSNVFLFFYRVANQGEGRVIPQIKAAKLQTLPFPAVDSWTHSAERLSRLCHERLALSERAKRDEGNVRSSGRIRATEDEIDRIAAETYGLNDEDLAAVRAVLEPGLVTVEALQTGAPIEADGDSASDLQ